MRTTSSLIWSCGLITLLGSSALGQGGVPAQPADSVEDPIKVLVGRLELERYKATIKGLTQFGDRRQGTDRNRAAVDWIEAQLKSYGCTNTERIRYEYAPVGRGGGGGRTGGGGRGGDTTAAGAARGAGGVAAPAAGRGAVAAGAAAGRGGGRGTTASGGGRIRGLRARTGVNNDSLRQPDPVLRALNAQPTTPGPREEVFCTKVGTTRPDEMYIVGAHMDGHGWGEAANDDGSGTAIVMELARLFSNPDVETERSIRFILWNNEETGLNGSRAYVEQRRDLQGREDPPGSGRYPEPKIGR